MLLSILFVVEIIFVLKMLVWVYAWLDLQLNWVFSCLDFDCIYFMSYHHSSRLLNY